MVKLRYKILFYSNGDPKAIFSNKILGHWAPKMSKYPILTSDDPESIAMFIKGK